MALSNIMSMMQMQQRDFHAAINLVKMGCTIPEKMEQGKGGLADQVAQTCPKDDVELSKAVQAELAALHKIQTADSAHDAHHGVTSQSKPAASGGISGVSLKEAGKQDLKNAQAIGNAFQVENAKLDAPMNDFFAKTGRKPVEVNLQSKLASDKVHAGFDSMVK